MSLRREGAPRALDCASCCPLRRAAVCELSGLEAARILRILEVKSTGLEILPIPKLGVHKSDIALGLRPIVSSCPLERWIVSDFEETTEEHLLCTLDVRTG